MSMCESILTIALVCTVKYLHYCDYYYTLGNDSQSTPKLIAYFLSVFSCSKPPQDHRKPDGHLQARNSLFSAVTATIKV